MVGLLLSLLGGCGYTAEAYTQDVALASCEIVLSCTDWYEGVDDCVAAARTDDRSGCGYDAAAARACVTELRESACAPDGTFPAEPEPCRRVWTGCGEPAR